MPRTLYQENGDISGGKIEKTRKIVKIGTKYCSIWNPRDHANVHGHSKPAPKADLLNTVWDIEKFTLPSILTWLRRERRWGDAVDKNC